MTGDVTDPNARRAGVRRPGEDEDGFIFFGDEQYDYARHTDRVIVRRPHLDGCLASELEAAFTPNDEPDQIYVTDDDDDNYDEDESGALPVSFDINGERVRLLVEFVVPPWSWENGEEENEIRKLLQPLLDEHQLTEHYLEILSGRWGRARLDFAPRDRPLLELLSAGEDIVALLDASNKGVLTLETATRLVKSGHAAALVGQPEGKWFDAKSSHYAFPTANGKVDLAGDVAIFCNGDHGGIIVVGVSTSKINGSDVVDKLTPLDFKPSEAFRYRQLIDQYLYPPVVGLTVTAVPTGDSSGMFMLIEIPPQPEYNKPYLVHGAMVGEKFYGAFIGVAQRRDENSEPYAVETIHSWITTGRALIQRGELPGDSGVSSGR